MGGLTDFRNHLFNLFAHAFRASLDPSCNTFCLLIIDVMQFLAKVKFHQPSEQQRYLDAERVAASLKQTIQSYMHSPEYSITKGVVVLLDTPKNVASNKSRSQANRDSHTKKKQKEVTMDEKPVLDEQKFLKHFKEEEATTAGLGASLRWPVSGETIWRSNNLKFQLYCLVTRAILSIKPKPGMKLVLDDGILVSDEVYKTTGAQMIEDYGFEEKRPYEQECLVANLARHHFTQRFVVTHESREPERKSQTCVGEADVKIPRFIVYGNNTNRYMVVSQDTDIIFILLLHMKTLLNGVRAQDDANLEVWLDTQTPEDRRSGVSRAYRFINIKELYYSILELFALEYPSVTHPIETLVFLAYALETDFTQAFPTCLAVTDRVVWNTFSMLHSTRLSEHGCIRFNNFIPKSNEMASPKVGVQRGEERVSPFPSCYHNILSNALQYTYDGRTDYYDITLDQLTCQNFFYLLCQQKVLDDLSSLGHSQFDKKRRQYITKVDELFIWTAEIEARIQKYRDQKRNKKKDEESRKRKAFDELHREDEKTQKPSEHKRFKLPSVRKSLSTTTPDTILDMMPEEIITTEYDDEFEGSVTPQGITNGVRTTPITVLVEKKLETLSQKELPKDYGIPRLPAMLARLYRIEWLLNYHQNGWKSAHFGANFVEHSQHDPSLSRYGWRAEEVPQSEESVMQGDFNNAYYNCVYVEKMQRGLLPFKVYRIKETDEVYNKCHSLYSHSFGL